MSSTSSDRHIALAGPPDQAKRHIDHHGRYVFDHQEMRWTYSPAGKLLRYTRFDRPEARRVVMTIIASSAGGESG